MDEASVSRSAQQVLEFDKLKQIVGGYSTCVPGRRAIETLEQSQDAAALNAEFALVREAAMYLRTGSELGFGSLTDPDEWLARLGIPASVLEPKDFLNVCTLIDSVEMARASLKDSKDKYPQLAARAAALMDQRWLVKAIRHAILPNGEISDDASPQLRRIRAGIVQGREKMQRTLETILRGARRDDRRGLHHAAQRAVRDSGARFGSARGSGRGARRERQRGRRFSSSRSKRSI